MTGPLAGQAALVIGGGKGIGRATAAKLAACGAVLVLVDPDPIVEEVAADLGPQTLAIVGDGSDNEVLRQAVDAAAGLGRLSTLVYCAAYQPQAPVVATAIDDWDRTFAVTVRGSWLAAITFAAAVRETGSLDPDGVGSITLVSSLHAYQAYAGSAAYGAAKAALLGLTRSLAAELGPDRIRCNAVAPGFIAVERNRAAWEPAAARERVRAQNPLRRLGRPEDVANAVAFLASAEAAHINGICLPIDAGEYATYRSPTPGEEGR